MFDVTKALIPQPQQMSEVRGEKKIGVLSRADFSLTTDGVADPVYLEALSILKTALREEAMILETSKDAGAYPIIFKVDSTEPRLAKLGKKEAYTIDITDRGAVICGVDAAGALYAAVTLSHLLYVAGDELYLPLVSICDWPSFSYRSQFMECRHGSDFLNRENMFELIDYFVGLKQNHLNIAAYGCWGMQYDDWDAEYLYLPFKKYPQLKTPRTVKYYSVAQRKWIYKKDILPTLFKEDSLGEVIAYGKKKNVKVHLLFNSFGHNTVLPRMFPELSAKDAEGNPTYKGVCTEGEETFSIMCDLYDEIIDRYLAPNGIDSIHLGLDEVYGNFCECEKCRDLDYQEMLIRYVIKICHYLKTKGIKNVYMYHDMLFNKSNRLNEELKQRLIAEGIYDMLIIDWWSYRHADDIFRGRLDQINNLFRSIIKPMTGYYHWSVPTENSNNIYICAKKAKELGYEGIEPYGDYEYSYDKNFHYAAELAWNIDTLEDYAGFMKRYARFRYPGHHEAALEALTIMNDLMPDDKPRAEGESKGDIDGLHQEGNEAGKAKRSAVIVDDATIPRNLLLTVFDYYLYCYRKGGAGVLKNFPGEIYKQMEEEPEKLISYLADTCKKAKRAIDLFAQACGSGHKVNDAWLLTAGQYYVTANEFLSLYQFEKRYAAKEATKEELQALLERLIEERERVMKFTEDTRLEGNQYVYLRNMSVFRQYLLDLYDYVKRTDNPVLDLQDLSYVKTPVFDFIR